MRKLFIFLGLLSVLQSCKVMKSSLMLKTPPNYNYDHLIDSISRNDYRIAAHDAISYRVITNDGFQLVNVSTAATNLINFPTIDIRVEADGTAKLPLIGSIKIAGLSIVDAEHLLEEKYSVFYIKPFINIKITNKRVIIFPGMAGAAKVLPITNNNTTVMEALAMAGGISEDGKAFKVKLIRNTPGQKPQVYLMDLSKIDGLAMANTQVQAYDLIYVESRYRPIKTFVNEIAPALTLLSTILILYSLVK